MKLAAAARRLKLAVSTVITLVNKGVLEIDPETDSGGARFIRREVVEAYWIARGGTSHHRAPVAAVPLAEVSRFTGYSSAELMDLVHASVLEQLPSRRHCELTARSLRS